MCYYLVFFKSKGKDSKEWAGQRAPIWIPVLSPCFKSDQLPNQFLTCNKITPIIRLYTVHFYDTLYLRGELIYKTAPLDETR